MSIVKTTIASGIKKHDDHVGVSIEYWGECGRAVLFDSVGIRTFFYQRYSHLGVLVQMGRSHQRSPSETIAPTSAQRIAQKHRCDDTVPQIGTTQSDSTSQNRASFRRQYALVPLIASLSFA